MKDIVIYVSPEPPESNVCEEGSIIESVISPIVRKLVKVPEPMYQVFFDWAQTVPDRDKVRMDIFRELKQWVQENYPGFGIIHFADYSNKEAIELSKKLNQNITWGMYLLLEYGTDSIIQAQESNLIENIQRIE